MSQLYTADQWALCVTESRFASPLDQAPDLAANRYYCAIVAINEHRTETAKEVAAMEI